MSLPIFVQSSASAAAVPFCGFEAKAVKMNAGAAKPMKRPVTNADTIGRLSGLSDMGCSFRLVGLVIERFIFRFVGYPQGYQRKIISRVPGRIVRDVCELIHYF